MKSIYGFVRAPGRTDFGPIGAGRERGGALQFRLVGPLPPYSFSTVRLARAQGAECLLIEPIEAS